MPSLRGLCGSITTDEPESYDLQRQLRSKQSFKASQQVKQQLTGAVVQPTLVPRASDALVNLHGRRGRIMRSASESWAMQQRSQFVRLSSMSRGLPAISHGTSLAPHQQQHSHGLPAVETLVMDQPTSHPSGSPTAVAEVSTQLPPTPSKQQQQQQDQTCPHKPAAQQQQQQQQLTWSNSRRLLDFRLQTEQAASAKQSQPDELLDDDRLQQRLQRLGLDMLWAEADGNCQFRSFSQQLTGTQDHHAALRQRAVDHIRDQREEYELFLGEDMEEYLEAMGQDGTWGDELTLRALSDALRVTVHVITSDQHHWYLQYQPQQVDPRAPEVFLTYVAPIHYNSLRRQPVLLRSGLAGSFKRGPSHVPRPPLIAAGADN